MLSNMYWGMFAESGNIAAYLAYRRALTLPDADIEAGGVFGAESPPKQTQ